MQKEKVKHYRKVIKFIFLAGLFISPFIFWLPAEIPFEIPKVWFILRWIETLAVVGIVSSFFVLKKQKLDNLLILLVFLFLVQTLISSILGLDLVKSFFGNYYRGDGIFTLIHLIILFTFITLFFQKSWLEKTSTVLGLSSILLSLLTLINWVYPFLFEPWEDNAQGITFGNPNFLSGYLLVTLPFSYKLFKSQKAGPKKILFLAFLVIQIAAIIFTKTSFGIPGVVIFFLLLVLSSKRKKLILSSALIIILILLSITLSFFKNTSDTEILVAEGRVRIIRKAFLAFQERPIFGWGWANFDYAFESVDWPIHLNNDVYVDKAHSYLLEVLLTTGLTGFLIYLSLIIKVFFKLFSQRRTFPYLLAFILFLIHSQVNVISISEDIIFWISVGVATKEYDT